MSLLLTGAGSFSTPTITVSTASLPFGNQQQDAYSASKNYAVSGSGLSANIVITAPAGFIINTNNSNTNQSPITLTQVGGVVNSTTIYVKFLPTALIAYSANITHTSTGALSKNVAVTGTGVAALLFDLYPGQAAGFAVNKLRTAQVNCVDVIRSSDSTIQTFGFVHNLMDTTSILTFCGVGDGFVTKWYDQSGNGYDISQLTVNKWPQIVASGALVLENGLPSVDWDLSPNRYMNAASAANWKFLNDASTFSIYSVIRINTISTVIMGTNGATSAKVGYWMDYSNAGNDLSTAVTNGAGGVVSFNSTTTETVPTGVYQLLVEHGDPGNATAANRDEIYINAGSAIKHNASSAALANSNPFYPLEIGGYGGGTGTFKGRIGAKIFYPVKQTTNDTAIRTYLNSFFLIY